MRRSGVSVSPSSQIASADEVDDSGDRERQQGVRREPEDRVERARRHGGDHKDRHADRHRDRHRLHDGAGQDAAPGARIVERERDGGEKRE